MNLKKIFAALFTISFVAFEGFSANVYLEIEAIESKKQDLLSARNGNPAQESEILENARIEYQKASSSIDNEILRIAETDADGNMLAEVKRRRLEEKKAIKEQIDQRAKEEIAALKTGDSSFEYQLVKEIEQMENDLKQERVIDSFEDPRILTVKTYAGDKYYWNTVVRFYLDNKQIFSQNVTLNYQNISGKSAASISKSDESTYNDYLDTVDYYDGLLKANDGTIVAQIAYVVQAMDKSQPSTYKVTINSIRFVNTETGAVLQTVTPLTTTYTFKMSPQLDIRTDEEKGIVSKNKTAYGDSSTSIQAVTTADTSSESKNKTVTSTAPSKEQMLNTQDGRFLLGLMFGDIPDYLSSDLSLNAPVISAFMTVPIGPYFYFDFECGGLPTPKEFGKFTNPDGYVFQFSAGGGIYYQLPLKWFKPAFYMGATVGIGTNSLLVNERAKSYDGDVLLLTKFNFGVDFPIGDILVLSSEGSMWYVEDAGWAPCCNFGVSLNLN